MKKKHTIFLALLTVSLIVSCEIDDDFGEYNPADLNPPLSLVSDAQWMAWMDNENLIYWTLNTSEIKSVNIKSKSTSVFYSLPSLPANETYFGFYAISSSELAAIANWHDTNFTQFKTILYLIDLATDELTMLTENLDLNTNFDFNRKIIRHGSSLLAYAVYSESYLVQTWIYDLVTEESSFVGPGYPVVFSPDGGKLLCHDYSSGTYIYNVDDKTQGSTSFTLNYTYDNKVRWTDEGIIEGYVISNYPNSTIQIHNLTTNELKSRPTGLSSSSLYLSPSGKKLIDGRTACLSPYLKECVGQAGKLILSLVDIDTNQETVLIEDRADAIPGTIEGLEFSPDETNIAFLQGRALYVNQK